MKLFKGFTTKNYADQGKAFLNAYWGDCGESAEKVWNIVNKFVELDLDKAENGCDLDEFNAHRVLEFFGETKTVKEMREELLKADLDFNKRLAVIEYCLWSNGKTVSEFVKRPQGESDAIKKAQEMLNQVLVALEDAKAKAAIAKEKLAEAVSCEKQAKADLEEQKAALAEVQQLEDAYNKKTESLKAKTETGGVVTRNRAKNELAQHLAEDPLPLRTAKISNEAATRKAEKSTAAAVAARESAEAAKKEADDAVATMQQKMAEAQAALDDAKKTGCGQGNIWWIERQLTEAKKYMPMSKGGISKK